MATQSSTRSASGEVRRVIVVGGGLAGLMTVIKLCEAGVPVDLFSLVPVKRSHSVCAQGGINASVNTKGEGDSPQVHLEETVYGGDFLANQPPVKGMADAAPGIVFMLDRMGVPFNRTNEGLLDFRRFGGTLFHRTAFAGATTGQQLLYALDEQVRRYEAMGVEDERGVAVAGEKMVRKREWWDFLGIVRDDTSGRCVGIVAQDLKTMEIRSFAGDAVALATGGCGIVFGRSTNSVINTGTATSAVYQQGACYANGEFIQVHPTAIPGADKLRLISESVRGEGGRVWVPKDPKERRKGKDVPEDARDYFLEAKYPGYGNLVPRDIASRELFLKCFHEKRGIFNPRSAKNENEVYLDVTHLPEEMLRKKLAGVLEIYEKFVGDDPYHNPMKVFPAVHYSMGGLWVDFERAANGSLVTGSARNQATNIEGLYACGECEYQYHGANRLGANSLLSCIYGGMECGPAMVTYRKSMTRSSFDVPKRTFELAEKRERDAYERILKMDGDENPYRLHEELAQTMLIHCTIERHNPVLDTVLAKIEEVDERSTRVGVTDTATGRMNQGAQFVRHLKNMIVLARVIAQGARNRDESRGAHFKPEIPKRDDVNWLRTTLAFHRQEQGGGSVGYVRDFDYSIAGKPIHVTDAVDISLVKPRARKYETAGAASATATAASADATGVEMSERQVRLKVRRQDGVDRPESKRWEEFVVDWQPQMNVISVLMEIRKNPVTAGGIKTTPVVWESVCLEEVCGSCTMIVNGKVRQSCTAMVDALAPNGETITLEPMSKFPLVRDLVVDRSRMFESLQRVKAWIQLDGSHELGPGPRQSQENQEEAYPLSRCMTCGCCLEACPQINDRSDFIGAAAINQVRLFNLHPSGKMHAGERLDAVMGDGGIEDCGKAQNCAAVCPKEIPLVDSIADVGRQATKRMLFGWLLK